VLFDKHVFPGQISRMQTANDADTARGSRGSSSSSDEVTMETGGRQHGDFISSGGTSGRSAGVVKSSRGE
jgi:hypothetical protein